LKVIEKLQNHGFKTYIVGGYVRDALLGRQSPDCDICTSANSGQIKKIFKKYICVGEKHGTITVQSDNKWVEVTTLRIDGTYSNNRHPDKIEFTDDIEIDLSRRDFTVNAMAYSPFSSESEQIIDIFHGISDLKNKIIRCVRDPNLRFQEDALRILRAIRFSSYLDFDIESCTYNAILNNLELLKKLSKERITQEFLKILAHPTRIELLIKTEIFQTIFNVKFKNKVDKNSYKSSFILTKKYFSNLIDSLIYFIFELYLMSEISLYDLSSKIFEVLKINKSDKLIILKIIENLNLRVPVNFLGIKLLINEIGQSNFEKLIKIQKNITQTYSTRKELSKLKLIEYKYRVIIKKKQPIFMKDLSITGKYLQKIGYHDKQIGQILDCLLEFVTWLPENNTDEYLKKILSDPIDLLRNSE